MGKLLTLNISDTTRRTDIRHNGEIFPVIQYKDMPKTITAPFYCGDHDELVFSFYKGVIVQWDEDKDTRVLKFLDEMDFLDRLTLLLVAEHKGCVSFLWNGNIPSQYTTNSPLLEIRDDDWGCDWWTIQESEDINDR